MQGTIFDYMLTQFTEPNEIFGPFDFAGVEERLPTRTFSGTLTLTVGDRTVELVEVGPAHTAGDVLVHLPDTRTVFTGDILFIGGTPIIWAGPVSNWLNACDRIIDMSADVIVPGHGPITDNAGVTSVKDYLQFVHDQARARFDADMDAREATFDIALGAFADLGDAERLAVNVATLYREFGHEAEPLGTVQMFTLMAELAH